MIASRIAVKEAQTPREIERFLRFPWKVYKNNPAWVPQALCSTRKFLKGEGKFFEHCRFRLFTVEEEGRLVATLAAFSDHHYQSHWNERAGFLGFFEALPGKDAAVCELFQAAENWLRLERVETVYAPVNGQVCYPSGLLENDYGLPPRFLMAYNPEYYHRYLERAGYEPAKKLIAYTTDLTQLWVRRKISAVLEDGLSRGFRVRPFDKKHYEADARLLARMYAATFNRHFGYSPSSEEEFLDLLEPFRPILDPDLILFAQRGEAPAGFVLCVPDFNPAIRALGGNTGLLGGIPFLLRLRRVRAGRVIAIGVAEEFRGKNVAPFLTASAYNHMVLKGYVSSEYSWVLEDNLPSRRVAETFYGDPYRQYRVYGKKLTK